MHATIDPDGRRVLTETRTARLERDDEGRLTALSDTVVTDEAVLALIHRALRAD